MKSIRRLDGQGRVILPAHIRKALDLDQNSPVEITMNGNGSITIKPAEDRCCICGANVTGKRRISVHNRTGDKYICAVCEKAIRILEEKDE